ncbi:MAG: hypothetical protein GY932_03785 [Arcobacter sp.]|nr:hypothetical protein [Arcobacter sp.]
MNRKQEIKNKMNKSPGGLCCISVDKDGNLTSPVFGIPYGGPTETITIYRNSVEELLQEIDRMSTHIKRKYGSPYGNQTCDWS